MEENIADALKMAGSVLLFVIGLSIAILSFSQARGAIDAVLSYSDRESLTIRENPRFYYLSSGSDTNRYVGKETIIPTLYRAYKENYKIVFKFPDDDDYYLFEQEVTDATTNLKVTKKIVTIDLANQSIGSDLKSRQFLNGIIYGKDEEGNTIDLSEFNVEPNSTRLYDYLTSKEGSKIKESLGTYYMEDVNGTDVEDVNKWKKRVITYTFLND